MKYTIRTTSVIFAAACLFAASFSLPALAAPKPKGPDNMQPNNAPSIVGTWTYKDAMIEIVTEFRPDGTFHEVDSGSGVVKEFDGVYRLTGRILEFQANGSYMQAGFEMTGPDSAAISYPNGRSAEFRRVRDVRPSAPPAVRESGKAVGAGPAVSAKDGKSMRAKPAKALLMRRVAEPNEGAFTVLVPKGWQTSGGIFNVSPMQTGGAANSLVPKCDFTVKIDDAGTVMIRWIPTWNFADLRNTATGGMFQSGQYYQGMPVRYIVGPDQFISQLMGTERPNACNVKVIGTDPMNEITAAFHTRFAGVNQALANIGIAPMNFQSLAVLVEYNENGVIYREVLFTTISDNRAGALSWSNENTLMFRAPAGSFDQWKGVLDMIRESLTFNPNWLASVQRNGDARAKEALETQRYINRVNEEIAANHARTNAEIAHEDWLLLTSQEEYKNPYTGEVERGTSEYAHRWENNEGDILYTNENGFDPNSFEEYNSREWKKSEVWDRK